MQYAKDEFLASLARCREVGNFTEAFYERLLASDDEIRKKFRFTDMEAQQVKLSKSLDICAAATAGDSEALTTLRELGKSHDRWHLDIRPEWYPLWIESIVATAKECDPKWNTEIEAAWRRVLGLVTKRIASFYDS